MKKIALIAVVAIVILLGYNTVKGYIKPSDTQQEQPPPVTTSAPTVFDNLNAQIATINSQLITLKTNDTVIQSKIDQLTALVKTIQTQIAALGK